MRHPHYSPATPPQQCVETHLINLLDLRDFRASVTKRQLARTLWIAALLLLSLSAVARWKIWRVSAETLRRAWRAVLPRDRATLLQHALPHLQPVLSRRLRRRLARTGVRVAFDYHGRPFYGRRDDPHIVGGKAKKSTRWFWTYATATIVDPGFRWTFGVTWVTKQDTPDTVLQRLLQQLEVAGLRLRCVLLDSGFYSAKVIHVLQQRHLDFVLPAIRRGRGMTGTQPFFAAGQRGWFTYTWKGRVATDPTVTVSLACLVDPAPIKARSAKQLVYVCSRRLGTLRQVWSLYARRFGIEASYRQLGQTVPLTTSADPVWRFALIVVAVAIRNLWVGWQLGGARTPLRLLLLMLVFEWSGSSAEFLSPNNAQPPHEQDTNAHQKQRPK